MTKWEKTFAKYFRNEGLTSLIYGRSQWLINKESVCNAGGPGSTLGQEDPPEEETATHYSVLAQKIPWTEDPGELQSTGSQRVRHD